MNRNALINKEKKIPRLLAAALCLAACAGLICGLCGCGLIIIETEESGPSAQPTSSSGSPETASPATGDETTEIGGMRFSDLSYDCSRCEEAVRALTYINLSKYTFMVTVSDSVNDTLFDDSDPDLAPLYAERNTIVKNRYLAGTFSRTLENGQFKAGIKASVKAGSDTSSYFSDAVLVPALTAGELAVSGLLLDLRKLPYYSAPGTGSEGAGYINTRNYVHVSEATFDIPGTLVLFFNRGLLGSGDSKRLSAAALDGEFTFEAMLEAAASHRPDDGGSAFAVSSEAGGTEILADIAAIRSGYDFTADANGTAPVLASHSSEEKTALAQLISGILSLGIFEPPSPAVTSVPAAETSAETGPAAEAAEPDPGFEAFNSGKIPFYVGTVSQIRTGLLTSPVRWGILPLPYAGDGTAPTENISAAGKPVVCVPANNSRFELTGAMLSAFAAASGSWIRDGFAASCIANYLRDNDSYYTLRAALEDAQHMDLADIYSGQVKNYYDATYGSVRGMLPGGDGSVDGGAVKYGAAVNKLLKALK